MRKSATSTAEKQLDELLPWKRVAATDKAPLSVKERLTGFTVHITETRVAE